MGRADDGSGDPLCTGRSGGCAGVAGAGVPAWLACSVIAVLLLVGSAVAIYLACEWFVNAVEWLGQRLRLGPLAVGTILAAIGTALPESVVTFVAVVFGRTGVERDIGVGAAMGGPLALATIAYAVVGLALLGQRREPAPAEYGDGRRLRRDQVWFLAIFVVKVGLGLVVFAGKSWLGLIFFAVYGVYFWREVSAGRAADHTGDDEGLAPLRIQPRRPVPASWAVVAQTLASLAVIFIASQVFVHSLGTVGPAIGLPATVTALLLSPIATELPETLNALIWVRQGKTSLALANISGSMMIQATVPSGLGLLFTPWRFDAPLIASGVVTMAAIGYLLWALRTRITRARLAVAVLFYLAFAAALTVILS
ncbi:MAG: cation:H+ antiporter [Micromonosporaceae bacterium]|nr:cation:H+ antiporter [Micromonosporaceae bacterium]